MSSAGGAFVGAATGACTMRTLTDGAVAQERVDPLEDLAELVLDEDRARAFDPERQHAGSSRVASPRGQTIFSGRVHSAKRAPTMSGHAAMRSAVANPRCDVTGSMTRPTSSPRAVPRPAGAVLSAELAMRPFSHVASSRRKAVARRRDRSRSNARKEYKISNDIDGIDLSLTLLRAANYCARGFRRGEAGTSGFSIRAERRMGDRDGEPDLPGRPGS